MRRLLLAALTLVFMAGCAMTARENWLINMGPAKPRVRAVDSIPNGVPDYWTDVKPVLEARCASCHACYDAPCQLKVTAIEGLERGAHKEQVYTPSRITSAVPKRLFEDAHSPADWRKLGYFPVLSEYDNRPKIARQADLIYRALELKENNPLPDNLPYLPSDVTIGLGRKEECPTAVEFDRFAAKHPQWGMPYALPGLNDGEQETLKSWVEAGAPYTPRTPLSDDFNLQVKLWEHFLNGDSKKSQLVSRYIYEHLFLNHLYFPELSNDVFFKIIRSSTGPGTPAQIIATRRPFDSPMVKRVYYRLVRDLETTVDKTHNPYTFGLERLARYNELFIDQQYNITHLPGYTQPDTANPFATFEQLPMTSRYKFLLDDAQSSIMNFIKGSVCRGQVAVNVIRDHFWVFFLDPDSALSQTVSTLLPNAKVELALANSRGDTTFMPIRHWKRYAKLEGVRRKGRDQFMLQYFAEHPLDLELIWDGDGKNPNAGLTVFRHNDSATIEQGLLGDIPQTAWVIDYTLLERIHYLLVAGYDVYGTLGHQLISRLHMDYLRMDGETNFLNFLPPKARLATRNHWYRQAPTETLEYLSNPAFDASIGSYIEFESDDPKTELMGMMRERVANLLPTNRDIENIKSDRTKLALRRLSTMQGEATTLLPELTVIRIAGSPDEYITLLRNNAHVNMTSIFNESKRLLPDENTVTVVNGVVGSYPNAFMDVPADKIEIFVAGVLQLSSQEGYHDLRDKFGIRRTHPEFWKFSDALHAKMRERDPINYGLLDYNRLENR